jgi:hypothetical protein
MARLTVLAFAVHASTHAISVDFHSRLRNMADSMAEATAESVPKDLVDVLKGPAAAAARLGRWAAAAAARGGHRRPHGGRTCDQDPPLYRLQRLRMV